MLNKLSVTAQSERRETETWKESDVGSRRISVRLCVLVLVVHRPITHCGTDCGLTSPVTGGMQGIVSTDRPQYKCLHSLAFYWHRKSTGNMF